MGMARAICRWLPPIAAQRVRAWIYPYGLAQQEDRLVRARAVTGGWFEGRTSDFHAYPMLVHGYFEWRNVAICAAVCGRGDTVIEVGANIGTETVSFADIVGPEGRVVALEPDEENAASLRRLVELNDWKQVEVVEAAVSDREGQVWFARSGSRAASGTGHVVQGAQAERTVAVRSVRLDSLLEKGCGRVAAIFMDVEGHEPAVLRGAEELLRRCRPVVVLEASPKLLAKSGWELADLAKEILDSGYECFVVGRFGLRAVDTRVKRAANWVCVPEERPGTVKEIQRKLRGACWMPMTGCLNPLARR